MKKIISLCIFLLMVSCVFAQNGNINKVAINSKVMGLENAMLKVESQERVQQLEQVLLKIQEQSRERLQKLEGLTIEENGKIIASGTTEAKMFGLFKFQHRHMYEITETGQIIRNKFWYDFLIKED